MAGAIVIVVVLVIVLPVSFLLGGAVFAAVLGWSVKSTAEADHQGSEFVDLNV
ncbi:MAG: hypothetical protein ACRD0U_00565 [Acidimicrobiales bacterium]